MTAAAAQPTGLDPFHRLLTSFAGHSCTQIWADFVLWELVLNEHPDLRAIIEIGTFKGGFSRYLWAQAFLRSIAFSTFDTVIPDDPPPGFRQLDVLAEPDRLGVALDTPVALFCDGGNKPAEVALFAPRLAAGSVVVVHDWLVEFGIADIPVGLEEAHTDLSEELGSMSRVLVVR